MTLSTSCHQESYWKSSLGLSELEYAGKASTFVTLTGTCVGSKERASEKQCSLHWLAPPVAALLAAWSACSALCRYACSRLQWASCAGSTYTAGEVSHAGVVRVPARAVHCRQAGARPKQSVISCSFSADASIFTSLKVAGHCSGCRAVCKRMHVMHAHVKGTMLLFTGKRGYYEPHT